MASIREEEKIYRLRKESSELSKMFNRAKSDSERRGYMGRLKEIIAQIKALKKS